MSRRARSTAASKLPSDERLTARYLIGTDGLPNGMMAEFPRILHARVP